MIAALIRWSVGNRFLVLIATLILTAWGVVAMLRTPGVVRVDDLKTRLFGSRTYVDAEIAVDGALPLRDAHVIAEAVHHELERDYPDVKHCTVHVNPA